MKTRIRQLPEQEINLILKGRYKDGGSERYEDEQGNSYWICNKFGDKNLKYKGKLFKGNINDFPKKITLAVGTFILNGKTKIIQYEN